MNNALKYGIVRGYAVTNDNYPPLMITILWAVGKIAALLMISQFVALKASLLAFLCATSFCVWKWTRDLRLALFTQLALTVNVLALGYTDVYFAPTLLLSLWALQQKRWAWFSVFYSVTCLVKYQALIFAPFLAIYILSEAYRQWSFRVLDYSFRPAGIAFLMCCDTFGYSFLETFSKATAHEYLSANALNFNWITTYYLRATEYGFKDGICLYLGGHEGWAFTLGKSLFYLSFIATIALYLRSEKTYNRTLLFSVIGFTSYFLFNTGVHENHLFAPVLVLIALAGIMPEMRRVALSFAAIFNTNALAFYGFDGNGIASFRVVQGIDTTAPLACLVTIYLFAFCVRKCGIGF